MKDALVCPRIPDSVLASTKSMFKGYGWLTASGMSWEDYWDAFRR